MPFGALLIICFAFYPVIMIRESPEMTTIHAYIQGLPVLILPAIIVYSIFAAYRASKKIWMASSELRAEVTYTFEEEGIKIKRLNSNGFTDWSNLNAIEYSDPLILVRNNQGLYYFIDTRSIDDLSKVSDLLEKNIGRMKNREKLNKLILSTPRAAPPPRDTSTF